MPHFGVVLRDLVYSLTGHSFVANSCVLAYFLSEVYHLSISPGYRYPIDVFLDVSGRLGLSSVLMYGVRVANGAIVFVRLLV